MLTTPWQLAESREIERLLERESRAWLDDLAWDVTEAWQVIEPARRAGRLAGAVVRDETGRIAGWCCYLVHREVLQIAILVADAAGATDALVEHVVEIADAAGVGIRTICVRAAAPGLRDSLEAHGFDVVPYRYLSATTRRRATRTAGLRAWRATDMPSLAGLLAAAYADPLEIRAFAPRGTLEEWRDYATGLVEGVGCGRFLPSASFVLETAASLRNVELPTSNFALDRSEPAEPPEPQVPDLSAAVLVTDLGAGTAHIAQIGIRPDFQGHGLGLALVEAALASVGALGFEKMSLLVSDVNTRAMALYARAGFIPRSGFVVGVCRQPRRLTSVALPTGGVSTRL